MQNYNADKEDQANRIKTQKRQNMEQPATLNEEEASAKRVQPSEASE